MGVICDPGLLCCCTESMCADHVYKRQRLRNSVVLLSPKEVARKGITASDLPSSLECVSWQIRSADVKRNLAVPLATTISVHSSLKSSSLLVEKRDRVPVLNGKDEKQLSSEIPMNGIHKQGSTCNNFNDSYSLSKSDVEAGFVLPRKAEAVDAGECSSSDIIPIEELEKVLSTEDLSLPHFRNRSQLGQVMLDNTSFDIFDGSDSRSFMSCKVCCLKDSTLKMLLCDHCDEAFHISCCKVREMPKEEWYCQSCLMKGLEESRTTLSGQLFYTMNEKLKRKALRKELGPILFMLRDTAPHRSKVRISEKHQAEVPEWTGPIADDNNFFGEPSELEPAEWNNLNGWRQKKSSRPNNIGNWLQCREIICCKDKNDDGVMCGKWRRAPFAMTQDKDWNCSCAVRWDPLHADCAVPQELETSEVLRHLKYIKLLRPRLTKEEHMVTVPKGQTKRPRVRT